jgi:uncharacterized repeat protein (TIGR01451 family)
VTNTSEGPQDTFLFSLGAHAWPASIVPYSVGPLMQGESAQFQVLVQIPLTASAGEIELLTVMASSVGDPSKQDIVVLTTTAEEPLADLVVSMIVPADPVQVGTFLTYGIQVYNRGPTKATEVTITDILPETVIYLSNDSGCSKLSGRILVCQLGKLARGAGKTIHFTVRPILPHAIFNQAVVLSAQDDPDRSNNWIGGTITVDGMIYLFPLIPNT